MKLVERMVGVLLDWIWTDILGEVLELYSHIPAAVASDLVPFPGSFSCKQLVLVTSRLVVLTSHGHLNFRFGNAGAPRLLRSLERLATGARRARITTRLDSSATPPQPHSGRIETGAPAGIWDVLLAQSKLHPLRV